MINALSVDVEEYFHPEEVRLPDFAAWASLPSRVEGQTMRVLEIFARHSVKGTFFILGWVAEKHPELVREIAGAGHEIGCHSYAHRLVYELSPEEFRADTERAVRTIADACGKRPQLYRAPSYSVTAQSTWALEILAELGFTHDSSIYPILHDRYGIPEFGRHPQVITTPAGPIQEVPIATVKLSRGKVAPVGGGGYLRLLPYCYTAAGIRRINQDEAQPACIYFHPWELDPGQPRLASGLLAHLRTYMGLRGMESKIDRLLRHFCFAPITGVMPAGNTERRGATVG